MNSYDVYIDDCDNSYVARDVKADDEAGARMLEALEWMAKAVREGMTAPTRIEFAAGPHNVLHVKINDEDGFLMEHLRVSARKNA